MPSAMSNVRKGLPSFTRCSLRLDFSTTTLSASGKSPACAAAPARPASAATSASHWVPVLPVIGILRRRNRERLTKRGEPAHVVRVAFSANPGQRSAFLLLEDREIELRAQADAVQVGLRVVLPEQPDGHPVALERQDPDRFARLHDVLAHARDRVLAEERILLRLVVGGAAVLERLGVDAAQVELDALTHLHGPAEGEAVDVAQPLRP